MASALYPAFKAALLNEEHDLNSDTIKAALVTDAYNATDTVVGDLTRVGTDQTLGSCSVTNGVFDTGDAVTTWSAVAAGSTIVGVVIWNDSHPSKGLIAFIDVTDTPTTGSDIIVTWDNGANKIFAL